MNDVALAYNQVSLLPRKGIAPSRSDCDTTVNVSTTNDDWVFNLPVIPANMKCSIDFEKADWLSQTGYFYILHRFYDYDRILEWARNSRRLTSLSVGVEQKDKDFIHRLAHITNIHVQFLTIDVAHGHCIKMMEMIEYIEKTLGDRKPFIIAGNVATPDGARDLWEWGADGIKIGIGQGHVCTTRMQTGFGMPMYTCVKNIRDHLWARWHDRRCASPEGLPMLIADGGVSHQGDVAKAIHAGADFAMVGSMFAKCLDSPAETIPVSGPWSTMQKRWYGSASEFNKGKRKHVEGIQRIEPCNGLTYEELLHDWEGALESAISYSGGLDLNSIRNCNIVRV